MDGIDIYHVWANEAEWISDAPSLAEARTAICLGIKGEFGVLGNLAWHDT